MVLDYRTQHESTGSSPPNPVWTVCGLRSSIRSPRPSPDAPTISTAAWTCGRGHLPCESGEESTLGRGDTSALRWPLDRLFSGQAGMCRADERRRKPVASDPSYMAFILRLKKRGQVRGDAWGRPLELLSHNADVAEQTFRSVSLHRIQEGGRSALLRASRKPHPHDH